MPTTYSEAESDVISLMRDVMAMYHQTLVDASVKIAVLMAATDNGESAVKHGGYPAYATIKIVSLRDRVTKQVDAEMLIDWNEWKNLRESQKFALIDHELTHIMLAEWRYVKEEDGTETIRFKQDDLGRPKLKIRKGDWNCGDGFARVVERHGDEAVEFLNIKRCHAYAMAAKDGRLPGG